jgi:hypothetical protein
VKIFLTSCQRCGGTTSKKYARDHGLCKSCNEPEHDAPTRSERIIDCGYQAYALEEGHYDQGDA